MLWGKTSFEYLKFIRRLAREIGTKQAYGNPLSADEVSVLSLSNQVVTTIIPPDLTLLEQARDSGHSIVIVEAHAGTTMLSNLGIPRLGMPGSVITQGAERSADRKDFNINTSEKDVQMQLLKLTKLLKKQQRLVRLFPDGPAGDHLEFDLFGRSIKIGQGAALLAYHGRAATFFAASRWDGNHFQLYFRPGPTVLESEPREVFNTSFYEFYLDCLRRIVSGAPEDMGLDGGFWRFLH